ncbi:unnamed protein product [Paramecium pentaurelia]|uniref:RING-type domain-containing protein n=1 Tax=Paramecium pentaurelia TaxID=43138 RepID=A0A8S1YQA8_9CILI|nr:unnamed protein product [Paramecium pentaurelia]
MQCNQFINTIIPEFSCSSNSKFSVLNYLRNNIIRGNINKTIKDRTKINLNNYRTKFKDNNQNIKKMNLLIGEEQGSKNCQIQENQQKEESDIIQIRFWEQIARGYQQEIQQLQQQLWENNLNKVYHKSNGVPKNFMEKIKRMKMGKSNKKCSICCNEFHKDESIMQLPCKHIFHENCCKSWLVNSRKCPNCRSDIVELIKNEAK